MKFEKNVVIGILIVLVLSGFHFYLGRQQIINYAPTYDEPVHLTAGYVGLKKKNYKFNGYHHPPFGEMWAGLGLVNKKVFIPIHHPAYQRQSWSPFDQYQFADTFLYKNRVDSDAMVQAGRTFQLILSIFLLWGMIFFTKKWAGWRAAFIVGVLGAFSPTLLAHGTLISTDLAFATFFFLFFGALTLNKNIKTAVVAGVFLGLCLASKYLALAVFPILIFLGCLKGWRAYLKGELKSLIRQKEIWIFWSVVGITTVMVLLVVFRGVHLNVYWEGLRNIVGRSQQGRSSFFLGEHGTTGWLLYFPTLFILKTPMPVLISFLLGIGLLVKDQKKIPTPLWIPPVLFFLLACSSKVQIGHRHILAIYPFVFCLTAWGLSLLSNRKAVSLFLIFGGWYIWGTIQQSPKFLSYFNELAGGSQKAYTKFTDSNVDWGQDLKNLSEVLTVQDRSEGIFLSYFGVADPHYYGIAYINVGSDIIAGHKDDREKISKMPTKLAVSVTNYQSTYYDDKETFKWLQSKNPAERVGDSIFLYDFAGDEEALDRLKSFFGDPL